jgi:hypothetical protein
LSERYWQQQYRPIRQRSPDREFRRRLSRALPSGNLTAVLSLRDDGRQTLRKADL